MKKHLLKLFLISTIIITGCSSASANEDSEKAKKMEHYEKVFNSIKSTEKLDIVTLVVGLEKNFEQAFELGEKVKHTYTEKDNVRTINGYTTSKLGFVNEQFYRQMTEDLSSDDTDIRYKYNNIQAFGVEKGITFSDYIAISTEKYSLEKDSNDEEKLLLMSHDYRINPKLKLTNFNRTATKIENTNNFIIEYNFEIDLSNFSEDELEDFKMGEALLPQLNYGRLEINEKIATLYFRIDI